MTEKRELAILRAAERLGIQALTWLPYTDECAEHLLDERNTAERTIIADLDMIRNALKETQEAILNIAEHDGAKGIRA